MPEQFLGKLPSELVQDPAISCFISAAHSTEKLGLNLFQFLNEAKA